MLFTPQTRRIDLGAKVSSGHEIFLRLTVAMLFD